MSEVGHLESQQRPPPQFPVGWEAVGVQLFPRACGDTLAPWHVHLELLLPRQLQAEALPDTSPVLGPVLTHL